MTTFITQWRETKDATLEAAIKNCQVAEDTIRAMQEISGEALATYDPVKINWCQGYINELRDLELKKFNDICAHILEYMEVHTKLSEEEIEAIKNEKKQRKGDITQKPEFKDERQSRDLLFGIWANVLGRNFMSTKPTFGPFASALPMKQAT